MNVVPVANQREHQQQKRDQQKAGSFRRVDRVAAGLVIVRGRGIGHAGIVALGGSNWVLGLGSWVLGVKC
jgi:hypothetical protein